MKKWEYASDKIKNKGKQMRSIWSIPLTPKREKIDGGHPTQKPIELLKRIIVSSSSEGDLILDPFNGSGTTGIVAFLLNRKYIGIDTSEEFLKMTKKRFKKIVTQQNKKIEDFGV
jgi:site-specific DNA-methyltransferase (adenine-specific)